MTCPGRLDWGFLRLAVGARHRPRHGGPTQETVVMRIPRTVKEIIEQAEELARRFEDFEPDPSDRPRAEAFAAPCSARPGRPPGSGTSTTRTGREGRADDRREAVRAALGGRR